MGLYLIPGSALPASPRPASPRPAPPCTRSATAPTPTPPNPARAAPRPTRPRLCGRRPLLPVRRRRHCRRRYCRRRRHRRPPHRPLSSPPTSQHAIDLCLTTSTLAVTNPAQPRQHSSLTLASSAPPRPAPPRPRGGAENLILDVRIRSRLEHIV